MPATSERRLIVNRRTLLARRWRLGRHSRHRPRTCLCPDPAEKTGLCPHQCRAGIGRGRLRLDGERTDRPLERRARNAVLRQDADPARARDHECGQVRQHRDGQPRGRGRHGISGDGRIPGALSGEGLRHRLCHVQRPGRRQAEQADRGQLQAQGALLFRLRLPPFLDFEEADRRAERPARPENPRAAVEDFRRHHQWARRQCRADGLWRGRHRRQAGRDRRWRPARRQHEGAQDLRSLEIRLPHLSQLRSDQRRDEPRHLERPDARPAETRARSVARRAGKDSPADRVGRSISPRPRRCSSRSA